LRLPRSSPKCQSALGVILREPFLTASAGVICSYTPRTWIIRPRPANMNGDGLNRSSTVIAVTHWTPNAPGMMSSFAARPYGSDLRREPGPGLSVTGSRSCQSQERNWHGLLNRTKW
jgi:hypothetical protein